MNKYKVLSLVFLLTFSVFTNAQQNKSSKSGKGQIVMTKDKLKSFLKMVAEKRIEQLQKAESQDNNSVKGYRQAAPRNNYQGYRQEERGGDLRSQIDRINTRLDNLMLALIAGGKGSNTVISSGTRPNDYVVSPSDNTSDQISNLERKLDSLKSVQYSNLAPVNNVSEDGLETVVTGCVQKPTKKCCAKKSEITPERRSALESLLAKFKNFKRQVFFANNSYSVSQEDITYLNRVAKVLNNNPELSVVLVGYASPVGSPEYNKQLSMKRAEAIAQELVKKGISESRIIPAFHGEDHSTTEAKARRVDMTVVIK